MTWLKFIGDFLGALVSFTPTKKMKEARFKEKAERRQLKDDIKEEKLRRKLERQKEKTERKEAKKNKN